MTRLETHDFCFVFQITVVFFFNHPGASEIAKMKSYLDLPHLF